MLPRGPAQKHDLSTVEIIAYGAEAMPQKVLNRLAKVFPNAQLQQKFGTSEGAIRIKSIDNESLFSYRRFRYPMENRRRGSHKKHLHESSDT